MLVNNIPEDPHVSRQNVMQTVSMVKNKFVQRNPHSRDFISEQHRMVQTLRENMGVTNFKMGHIAPEHRKLELRANNEQPANKGAPAPMSSTARQTSLGYTLG